MLKNIAFYVFTIGLFVGAVLLILHLGADLPPGQAEPVAKSDPSAAGTHRPGPADSADSAFRVFLDHLRHPLSLLLMQLIVIVTAARLVGGLFREIGQPSVVGEMVAGIVLGPSLLGMIWPATQSYLFPTSSMSALRLFSQVGVILYMFLVGIDLDLRHLRRKADAAVLVSHASIVVPFFLGTALCLFIYPVLAPSNIPFTPFALFLGIAMNTRGLMELIVLNIGYDMGILSPRVFTMMVLMALVTTFMAGPLLSLLRIGGQESEEIDDRQITHLSVQA